MAKAPALWDISAKKEVYDLLAALWPRLGQNDRSALVDKIAAGPPAWMSAHLPEADRGQLRARRIFERLRIMQRADQDHPHAEMEAELARLRELYPTWDVAPGDQAHFSFYSQAGWRVLDAVDDKRRLQAMTPAEVINELTSDQRDDALEGWREMVASDWNKMIQVLRGTTGRAGPDVELWAATLWGLRTKAATPRPGENVLGLVADMDEALARDPSVSSAAAYLLESAASSAQFGELPQDDFWRAFDKVAPGASQDESNAHGPNDRDWVAVAINSSMGNLALAFLNALFSRRLVVGEGMPVDLKDRFILLIGDGGARHRPARVVLASRLSYLFAIDPDLSRLQLLPSFRWERDEIEALAVWQGFGWQPHLDPLLWSEIKADFLACFQNGRIDQLGETVGPLAQALAGAGLHFGLDDLPRHATQSAIRGMDHNTRAGMLHWIAGVLVRVEDQAADPDRLWNEKVKPWIHKFWPRDPQIRSTAEARPWVEIALATNNVFEDAVETVSQFIRQGENDFVLGELANSQHLNDHPRPSLSLMDAFLSPNAQFWAFDDLRRVLDTVVASDPTLRDDNTFTRWDAFERARA